jgi:hypothetical protein
VRPDELPSNDDGVIERDRIADVSELAAVDAWMHLRNRRFVPDGIRGRLASMFDARGRPLGDPRLSMVREQAKCRERGKSAMIANPDSRELLALVRQAAPPGGTSL